MSIFLIVPGLPRCATTSFVNLLKQHPDVYVSNFKEPHSLLFNTIDGLYEYEGSNRKKVSKGNFLNYKKYESEYKGALSKYKVVVDASTLYSVHHDFINNLRENFSGYEHKFLVFDRDPYLRALSHYNFSVSRNEEASSFCDALNEENRGVRNNWFLKGYIIGSRIDFLIDKLLSYYHLEQIKLANVDNVKIFSIEFMREVEDFLGIEHFNYNFDVYSNSANFSLGKKSAKIRFLLKKIRAVSPMIFDNKVTRLLFYKILKCLPRNEISPNNDKDIYMKFFNDLGESKIDKNIIKSIGFSNNVNK